MDAVCSSVTLLSSSRLYDMMQQTMISNFQFQKVMMSFWWPTKYWSVRVFAWRSGCTVCNISFVKLAQINMPTGCNSVIVLCVKGQVFWDVLLFCYLSILQPLEGLWCFLVKVQADQEWPWPWRWRHHIPSKCLEPFTQQYSITSQETWVFRNTALRATHCYMQLHWH